MSERVKIEDPSLVLENVQKINKLLELANDLLQDESVKLVELDSFIDSLLQQIPWKKQGYIEQLERMKKDENVTEEEYSQMKVKIESLEEQYRLIYKDKDRFLSIQRDFYHILNETEELNRDSSILSNKVCAIIQNIMDLR